MTYTLLPKLLNMSLTASMIIIFVMVLRWLLGKLNAPKVFSYVLWFAVLFRLLCPVSFTSVFSALTLFDVPVTSEGAMEYIPENIVHDEYPQVKLPVPLISGAINKSLPSGYQQTTFDPLEAPVAILTMFWMLGVVVCLIGGGVSFWRFRKRLTGAVRVEKGIYQSDYLDMPFVIGLIQPGIYMPSGISDKEWDYILMHEKHHIRRGDHLIKLAAFLAAVLHWFNPLVWIMQIYFQKDMEMSCDETVMSRMEEDIRAEYANSLLTFSSDMKGGVLRPLAFGEHDAKTRIRNIMKWKRPGKGKVLMTVVLVMFTGFLLLANPAGKKNIFGVHYQVKEVLYESPQYDFSYGYKTEKTPQYTITEDGFLMKREYNASTWVTAGGLKRVNYTRKELYKLCNPFNNTGHENIDQVRKIWRVDTQDNADTFYLVMQKRNGRVILAQGYGNELEGHIRWLFELKAGSGVYDLEELEAKVESMCNNDVEYFAVSEIDSLPQYLVMAFHQGNDMGAAFFVYDAKEKEYDVRSYSDLGNQALSSMTYADGEDLDHSVTVALSRREDLALVTADAGDMHQEAGVTNICPVMVTFEWPDILPDGPEGAVTVRFYNSAGEELER